jgi:hypothetical protein
MKSIWLSEVLAAVQGQTWPERLAIQTLAPEDTGLPMVVFLSTRDTDRNGPQVKVSREHGDRLGLDRLGSVSVSDDPRVVTGAGLSSQDLRLVRAWVLLNKDVLFRYWNHALRTDDMMAALRSLGRPRGRQ